MKKISGIIMAVALLLCVCLGATACGGEKDILVISRDDSSGTRDAFDSLVKGENGATLKKDADGNEYETSPIVASAEKYAKTGDVLTKVSATASAIGYISLGSLNDTVKALKINGVVASAENVNNGSYGFWRPFVIVTKKGITPDEATADFVRFLNSTTAQEVVTGEKYIGIAKDIAYTAPESNLSGQIVIRGSTSVDPLMDKLIAKYKEIGGAKVSGVEFDKDAQGSSYGINAVRDDTKGNVIGMSSSAIKESVKEYVDEFDLAKDAVAVIVNKSNSLEDIKVSQLYDIYTGKTTKFSELG